MALWGFFPWLCFVPKSLYLCYVSRPLWLTHSCQFVTICWFDSEARACQETDDLYTENSGVIQIITFSTTWTLWSVWHGQTNVVLWYNCWTSFPVVVCVSARFLRCAKNCTCFAPNRFGSWSWVDVGCAYEGLHVQNRAYKRHRSIRYMRAHGDTNLYLLVFPFLSMTHTLRRWRRAMAVYKAMSLTRLVPVPAYLWLKSAP